MTAARNAMNDQTRRAVAKLASAFVSSVLGLGRSAPTGSRYALVGAVLVNATVS